MQVRSAAAQHTAVGAEMHRLCQQSQVQRIPGGVLRSSRATAEFLICSKEMNEMKTMNNEPSARHDFQPISEEDWIYTEISFTELFQASQQTEHVLVAESLDQVCCGHPAHQCLVNLKQKLGDHSTIPTHPIPIHPRHSWYHPNQHANACALHPESHLATSWHCSNPWDDGLDLELKKESHTQKLEKWCLNSKFRFWNSSGPFWKSKISNAFDKTNQQWSKGKGMKKKHLNKRKKLKFRQSKQV